MSLPGPRPRFKPVLDVVAENAARLCDAKDAVIRRIDGDRLRVVATYGPMPVSSVEPTISRGFPAGRAILDRADHFMSMTC